MSKTTYDFEEFLQGMILPLATAPDGDLVELYRALEAGEGEVELFKVSSKGEQVFCQHVGVMMLVMTTPKAHQYFCMKYEQTFLGGDVIAYEAVKRAMENPKA